MKIIDYGVVSCTWATPENAHFEIRKEVNKLILQGWQPLGGISSSQVEGQPDENGFNRFIMLTQAMVRYAEVSNELR